MKRMPADNITTDEVRNLKIRQTWIDEKVEDIQRQHGYESIGDAFASLTYSLIFDVDYDAIELDEIVDGKQDKQIDPLVSPKQTKAARKPCRMWMLLSRTKRGGLKAHLDAC